MIKESEVGEWIHGLKEKKTQYEGGRRKAVKKKGEERGTDRGILLVPLYFQPSVKMNFTS